MLMRYRRVPPQICMCLAVVLFTSSSEGAVAGQCPGLMEEVDAALSKADSSLIDIAEAMRHREAGESAHRAGEHTKSIEEFNNALEVLDVKSGL
jgi:hypothetical protein